MGEMADYYKSQETFDPFELPQAVRDVSKWVTEDRRVFKLTEMTDGHLINTIRFLEAKQVAESLKEASKRLAHILRSMAKTRARRIAAMRAEATRRGLPL